MGLLSRPGLKSLLKVKIDKQQHTKKIRAYGNRGTREETWSTFQLTVQRNEEAIAAHKKLQGWQIYATTVSSEKLDVEKIIWKYIHQNRVESRFNDLCNKVVPLVSIFLTKDNRIEALINVLMICLKVCCVIEFRVAKNLKEQHQELANIYEGNPKHSTSKPTAKRLLRQFQEISIVIIILVEGQRQIPNILLTDLTRTQLKIMDLLDFKPIIYTGLTEKLKLLFFKKKSAKSKI